MKKAAALQPEHRQRRPAAEPDEKAHQTTGPRIRDSRPAAVAQRQLAHTINTSPRQAALCKASEAFHTSPYGIVQRAQLNGLFGSTVQRQDSDDEEPALTCGVRVIELAGNRGGPRVRKDEVRFRDGAEWSIKWASGVGCVYFDIRSGAGAGKAYYNDETNRTGYSPGQMRQWLDAIDPGLANRWTVYWQKSKEVRGV